MDEDAWRTLEPGTAHPLQRLRAVRELVDAGINAGVLMAPIVPGFSSSRTKLERTIKAIADHGARFVGCNVMYLQDGTRDALHEVPRARVPVDGCRASSGCTRGSTRRRRTGRRCRGWCGCCRSATDWARRERAPSAKTAAREAAQVGFAC